MTKSEFLENLKIGLNGLPEKDVGERLAFYGEMIDDRIEDGKTENEAIAEIGDVNTVISQIISDIPLKNIIKDKITPKRSLKGYEIVLIILGFPLWFPLLISLFAVLVSFYAAVWAIIAALWAVDVSLLAAAFGSAAISLVNFFQRNVAVGAAALGAGLLFAGTSIFAFYGLKKLTALTSLLMKKSFTSIKKIFVKKENEQ